MHLGTTTVMFLKQAKRERGEEGRLIGPWSALVRPGFHGFYVVNLESLEVDGPYGDLDSAYGALLGRTEILGIPTLELIS